MSPELQRVRALGVFLEGRRIGVVTSSGGLAELILDTAASADLQLPPLSAEARSEIEGQIGFVSGDGNQSCTTAVRSTMS